MMLGEDCGTSLMIRKGEYEPSRTFRQLGYRRATQPTCLLRYTELLGATCNFLTFQKDRVSVEGQQA